jgi:hypothetical protein
MDSTGVSKKSFTTLKPYIDLFGGNVQCLNCDDAAKHLVLPEIVMVQCDFQW